MNKPMFGVLHASLKKQPLLLSISQDPCSAPKINNCLCTVILKNTKMEEEKGFLHREVKQATPPGYSPDSLVVEQCVCSYVTPSGYYPGLLVAEKHQRWKLILWIFFNSQAKLPFLILKHYDQAETFCCFWLSWKKVNHICHGLGGEPKVSCPSIKYYLKDQAPVL